VKKETSFSKHIDLLFKTKHNAIYDYEFQKHLKKAPWESWLNQSNFFDVKEEYIEAFIHWIYSSKKNSFSESLKDKKRYQRRDVIVGTTQSFDEAYFRYSDRRLRIFRGEYAYHRRCYENYAFLDSPAFSKEMPRMQSLDKNDWVIVSQPFCGTGQEHPKLKELLDQCLKKKIPVLIDCAWFGTCFDINFDLEHPAISEVSFSLTKGIGLGLMRTGLRFSNYPIKDNKPIAQQNHYKHLVLNNCQIGIYQMNQFSPDFQALKYLDWYKKLCKKYAMIESNCLHISRLPLDHPFAKHFLVDEAYSKVGIREALKAIRKKQLIL